MDWNELWRSVWRELLALLTQPQGGAGVVHELGPGNEVEEERMANAAKLGQLCEDAVNNPLWVAHDITGDGVPETFCNRSVAFVAAGMGCRDLRPDMSARAMLAALPGLPGWRQEAFDAARVTKMALRGVLVILGAPAPVHDHVVAAAPAAATYSTSWGGLVPMVAQVGTAAIGNGIKRLSEAFRAEARHDMLVFVWEPSEA